LHGLKPVQFGEAFYGQKGFTYDYNSINSFVKEMQFLNFKISKDEQAELEKFPIRMLKFHLVSTEKEGCYDLSKIFNLQTPIPFWKNPLRKAKSIWLLPQKFD